MLACSGCRAVNDAVVMREWGLAQKVDGKVLLLADADGSFRFAH